MHALRVSLLAVAATAVAEAGPAEQAIIAAMRLSERPNYSWHSSVTDDARTYDIEGRTDGSGCTWVRLPMVQSIADRLGRDADVDIEAFFLAGAPPVLHTARGWQSLTELPKWARDRMDGDVVLWSGDPLDIMSRALRVFINGREIYQYDTNTEQGHVVNPYYVPVNRHG